jgi:5-methylcytosine-specific restriction endonuclease McrA
LLAVIDEGRRTATYKLALLIALMDCCAEGVTPLGAAPTKIPTRSLARHVARLYWPQLRPFPAAGGPVDLRQITNKSATIIQALRSAFQALPYVNTWESAEELLPADHVRQVLDVVELTVARYPLVRLQTVDGVPQPFLYELEWGEGVSLSRLAAGVGAKVRLRPNAGDHLIRLSPLVRPLVELHWVRMVASLNGLALMEDDLRRNLFRAEQVAFPATLRKDLLDLQDGGCFYCTSPLSSTAAVDHFVPWSRWPNDAIENLVIAHASCNSHKSDHVPGPLPLRRWAERLSVHGADLAGVAVASRWRTDQPRSVSLARRLYGHLPAGSFVWNSPQNVTEADSLELLAVLAPLQRAA